MDNKKLLAAVKKAGHGKHVAELESLLQPAVFIHAEKLADAAYRAGEEDEEVVADGDDGAVHVSMDTCVAALGAAIGLTNPSLNPHDDEEAQELLFKPVHTKGRRG